MVPVKDPLADLGDDARKPLARTRDALKEANGRLTSSREWYDEVRDRAAGEGK
jgi:hypothetical protein